MIIELLSISRLLFCGMDVYMLYRFMNSMFKKRMNNNKNIILFLSIAFTIYIVNAFGITWINFIAVPLLFLIFSMLALKISLSIGIVYTIIYYTMFAGREVAFELMRRWLSEIAPFPIPEWFTSGGVYFLILEYIFAIIFLLYIEKFISKLDTSSDTTFCWYLLVLPVSSLIIMGSFLYMDFPESRIIQMLMSIGAFLLYLTNAVIFIILGKFNEALNRIKHAEINEMKKDMENNNYESILKINSVYREYMHEMRKYFNSFRNLATEEDTERIINIINELEGKMQTKGSSIIYSGNSVLNGILTEKMGIARENGIELTIFVEPFLNVDFISDGDMISMFGNLLDNAVEAAMKCKAGERKADIKLFMGSDYFLVLQIKNSYIEAACRAGGLLLSTKKEAQCHGLGIGIVKKLAERYGGTVELEEGEGEFTTILMLSVYIKE